MNIINIIADRKDIVNYALLPLQHNKSKLLELGYDVRINTKVSTSLFECDTLCVFSKSIIRLLKENSSIFSLEGPTLQFLLKAREEVGCLVWMDDSDSTTVTHFEVLPYVDKYLKKQLLKDRSLYRKEFYGGRIFSDYYHKKFNINDNVEYQQYFPLNEKYDKKVALSWNIGLGNVHKSFTLKSYLKRYFPLTHDSADYNLHYVSPYDKRPIDVFLRTSANLGRESIAFHRQEILRKLTEYQNYSNIVGMIGKNVKKNNNKTVLKLFESPSKRLSTRNIRKIMSLTKVMPSPFGWGEIGARDYEAFKYGSLLLKPDVSHMETWPNIFVPDKTFVSLKWDFSDLKEKLDKIISDDNYRIDISSKGQNAYKESLSEKGMDAFCHWFIKQIKV